MKSMQKMQAEMLGKARWDGGYPKVIYMGMGMIALARSEAEEKQLKRDAMRCMAIGVATGAVIFVAGIVWALSQ